MLSIFLQVLINTLQRTYLGVLQCLKFRLGRVQQTPNTQLSALKDAIISQTREKILLIGAGLLTENLINYPDYLYIRKTSPLSYTIILPWLNVVSFCNTEGLECV